MNAVKRVLAAMLALMLLVSGALAEEGGVVATVNGVNVPIDDAYAEYSYYAMVYEMYGYSAEEIAQLAEDVAEYYAQLEVLFQKFDELGLTVDMEQVEADAAAEYENTVGIYMGYVTGEDLTDEERREAAEAMMAEDGLDEAYFAGLTYDDARIQAVIANQTADVSVSDDEVKALYEERLAEDMALYGSDPAAYEEALSYGGTILYAPEGVRAVKHILVLLGEDGESRMYELEAELEDVLLQLAAANADIDALSKRKAEIELEMDEIFASIEPRAQEILDKLAAGGDFNALLAEYGEDPGMTYEPYMTDGYLVWADCESWVTAFRDGAMALEKVGDISQPVRTPYGLHIIRYERDIAGGAVPYEEASADLAAEMMTERQGERLDELLAVWYEAAEITLYPENLAAMNAAEAESAE